MDINKVNRKIYDDLVNCTNLKEILEADESRFVTQDLGQYIREMLAKKSISAMQLVKRTNIEKSYLYQIIGGKRQPGRDKLILICIALGLDINDIQKTLIIADRNILYPVKKRDAAIICCIVKGYPLAKIQETLYEFNLGILK